MYIIFDLKKSRRKKFKYEHRNECLRPFFDNLSTNLKKNKYIFVLIFQNKTSIFLAPFID